MSDRGGGLLSWLSSRTRHAPHWDAEQVAAKDAIEEAKVVVSEVQSLTNYVRCRHARNGGAREHDCPSWEDLLTPEK